MPSSRVVSTRQLPSWKSAFAASCLSMLLGWAIAGPWQEPLAASSRAPLAARSTTVSASKDCSLSPCTVTDPGGFQILIAQTVTWSANYTGTPTQGHDFWLSNSGSNMATIKLNSTSGQLGGSFVLQPGTYYISIRTFLMGPGGYSLTYNPSSTGEPHLITIDGKRYDFQGVGEFGFFRTRRGPEIQVRQGAVATAGNPGADPNGLAVCVSINTAVAARMGSRRVSYEPNVSGVPDPTGLQLRVNGTLTTVGPAGLSLGSSGRITRTFAPGGLQLAFPDGSALFVTPGWWADQGKWYLNLDFVPRRTGEGLIGHLAPDSWLPALPDGTNLGPMPTSTHDRYVTLYQKFADAWRVTDATTLFDYAQGTSTATFTDRAWPTERPPCGAPATTPPPPINEKLAAMACQSITGQNANCVYDVMVTGNPGFATTYALSQAVMAHAATSVRSQVEQGVRPNGKRPSSP